MSREKKSFDNYVVYFREGKLNDACIAKEMGVSRVNVGKMRRKWEEIKDDPEYINGAAKLTICEDTLNNILFHASQSRAQARDLKSQFSMAKSMLGLEFINSFSRYLELELKLDELKRDLELRKMSLCYKTMLKLKATDTDVRSKLQI
ncbi:DUF603 domain-containing protein (plasmid) [Borrelia puertoricensis]|uniref:DUF603 domain-containing protein n=1 Tax=Borrelia puertoricensis TaxID=2756107 RepID=UPI003EBB64D6